jgi:uncharacterized protein YacL
MITKKQFETAYRKFPPSKCELFYIKYISASSLYRNVWPVIISSIGLILPFLVTIISPLLTELSFCVYLIIDIFYVCVLASIGVYLFITSYNRRIRIRNICKELNITKQQYKEIVNKYYYENYYPDIKDYINSIVEDN